MKQQIFQTRGSSFYIVGLPMMKQDHFEYYLCCVKVRVCATARNIFSKLNQFAEEHGFDWIRCKSLAANGAAAIQGSTNGVVQKLKKFPLTVLQFMAWFTENLYLRHYFKKTGSVQVRRLFLMRAKNCEFHLFTLKEASNVFWSVQRHGSRRNAFIYHAEAWCLSRVKVLERVFQLRQKLRAFLAQKGHPLSINFQGNFWALFESEFFAM